MVLISDPVNRILHTVNTFALQMTFQFHLHLLNMIGILLMDIILNFIYPSLKFSFDPRLGVVILCNSEPVSNKNCQKTMERALWELAFKMGNLI